MMPIFANGIHLAYIYNKYNIVTLYLYTKINREYSKKYREKCINMKPKCIDITLINLGNSMHTVLFHIIRHTALSSDGRPSARE